MRIFRDCVEAAKEVERDLVELGQLVHPETMQDINVKDNPDYETRELVGYSYRIMNPLASLLQWLEHFKLNGEWLAEEMNERVSGVAMNPGNAWKFRKEIWEPFIHNGKFSYTYSERLSVQLQVVIGELRQRPNTRQAIITMYDHHDDLVMMGGKARIPCSLYYQVLIRKEAGESKLNLIYAMRSCDYYTHFPYDVALAVGLLRFIAENVGVTPGYFQHFLGSLHAYKRDYSTRGVF